MKSRKAAQVYFKNTDMRMLRWEELRLDSLGEKTGARVGVVNLCEMYNGKNEDWTDQERRQEREWAW